MLKIVLFCGGTGSIALQKGFAQLFGYKNYRLDAIINAYDNGKSTGACRKVFDGKILGPSDLRKNQLTQYEIVYEQELKDPDSYESQLLSLFELRFSEDDYRSYYERAYNLLQEACFLDDMKRKQFIAWLNYFFFQDRYNTEYRKAVENVSFKDFSLSNIFYASCAAMHGYSLEYAGKIMSDILKIDNRVHLISNVNLYLTAQTENGNVIRDEGDIVTWNKPSNRISEAVLLDEHGQVYLPKVDENNEDSVTDLLKNADIIICSTGTQWSSLIPTYMHAGFKDLMRRQAAKKYLVMNNKADADMTGLSATELLDTVSRYIDLEDVTIVLNDNAEESMRSVSGKFRTIHGSLSNPHDRKHIPAALATLISKDYFDLNNGTPELIADLDGTLWEANKTAEETEISIQNLALFRGIILSGNNYEHVYSIVSEHYSHHDGRNIYCDYGNTYFDLNSPKYRTGTLSEVFSIEEKLVEELQQDVDFSGKVTERGSAIITIKPLKDRHEKLVKVRRILQKYGNRYKAELAGHTSIDITRSNFTKAITLLRILENSGMSKNDVLYLGNELDAGNEVCIRKTGVPVQQINDVFEMNVLLKTYVAQY